MIGRAKPRIQGHGHSGGNTRGESCWYPSFASTMLNFNAERLKVRSRIDHRMRKCKTLWLERAVLEPVLALALLVPGRRAFGSRINGDFGMEDLGVVPRSPWHGQLEFNCQFIAASTHQNSFLIHPIKQDLFLPFCHTCQLFLGQPANHDIPSNHPHL